MQIKLFLIVFWTFFKITAVSFGGIYSVWALAEQELTYDLENNANDYLQNTIPGKNNTEQKTSRIKKTSSSFSENESSNIFQISKSDFKKIISFSSLMPGPRASGFSLIGYKIGGILLMVAVYLGLVLPGFIVVPILSKGYAYIFRFEFAKYFRDGANYAIIAILLIFCLSLLQSSQGDLIANIIFLTIVGITFSFSFYFKIHPLFLVICSAFGGYLFL
jgi:chromate transport protein ChrA